MILWQVHAACRLFFKEKIEAIYADKLSTVYDDIYLTRSTQNTIREFIRKHPTVYCSTHTPLGYENLERVS